MTWRETLLLSCVLQEKGLLPSEAIKEIPHGVSRGFVVIPIV